MFLRRIVYLYLVALTISSCNVATAQLVALPPAPELTDIGHKLIIEFEVGGKAYYGEHPEWPRGASGVTVGIGYDLGYNSRTNILSDFRNLGNVSSRKLANASGITGLRARNYLPTVRDILVSWQIALGVFDEVDVARTFALCQRTFRSFDDLRPNAQASLVSLVFNRGNGMSGPNRTEMRATRDAAPKRDYDEMALQLRKMKRVWVGTNIYNGMARRREAEARLMETK